MVEEVGCCSHMLDTTVLCQASLCGIWDGRVTLGQVFV
jgi:hypothetical protein